MSTFTETALDSGGGSTDRKKYQAWGIPEDTFAALSAAYSSAAAALEAVILSGLREGPLHKRTQEAFAEMERQARGLKRRYLLSPPLSAADMDALGLKARDTVRTPVPVPKRTVSASVSNPGPHTVQLDMLPGPAGDGDVSNCAYSIRLGIFSPDGAIPERSDTAKYYMTKVPTIPEDLPGQFTRKRRKESFSFTGADAGKTAYFSICYQNAKGGTGPWSGMIKAIIT